MPYRIPTRFPSIEKNKDYGLYLFDVNPSSKDQRLLPMMNWRIFMGSRPMPLDVNKHLFCLHQHIYSRQASLYHVIT